VQALIFSIFHFTVDKPPAHLAEVQPVGSGRSPAADEVKGVHEKPDTNKPGKNGGDLQVDEQEHHEHKDEISPELEAQLGTDPLHGLTDQEVEERRAQWGPNELKEVKKNPIIKFLGYFTGAIAYLIEVACIISAVVKVWGWVYSGWIAGKRGRVVRAIDAMMTTCCICPLTSYHNRGANQEHFNILLGLARFRYYPRALARERMHWFY